MEPLTEIQKAFIGCRLFRESLYEVLADEGAPIEGHKRVWMSAAREVFDALPEPVIKGICITSLQANDMTPAERAEIMGILRKSGTALTRDQWKAIRCKRN